MIELIFFLYSFYVQKPSSVINIATEMRSANVAMNDGNASFPSTGVFYTTYTSWSPLMNRRRKPIEPHQFESLASVVLALDEHSLMKLFCCSSAGPAHHQANQPAAVWFWCRSSDCCVLLGRTYAPSIYLPFASRLIPIAGGDRRAAHHGLILIFFLLLLPSSDFERFGMWKIKPVHCGQEIKIWR